MTSFTNAYNITIPDQSTTIIYSPYRDGDGAHGWQTVYSSSNESAYDPGSTENKASGLSSHKTTSAGASFQIDFTGSAITLFGDATGDVYTTTLDGGDAVSGAPVDGVLAQYISLDYEPHSLFLNVTGTDGLEFTAATITIGVGYPGATVSNSTIMAVDTDTGAPVLNDYFKTNGGGFTTDHDWQGYSRLDTSSVGGSISFKPANASAILVYGSSNVDHSLYSVQVSPAVGSTSGSRIFNASSRWFNYENIIYWESGMDRNENYEFTFSNLASGSYFDIHRVVVLDGEGGQSPEDESNDIGTGAIVGIAVGIAAILAVTIFGFFLWKRRRGNNRRDSYQIDASPANYYASDTGIHGHVEPFLLPQETSYSDNISRPTTGEYYGGGGYVAASARSSKYSSLGTPPTTPGIFYPGLNPNSSAAGSSSHTPSSSQDYGRGTHASGKHSSGPSESRASVIRQEEDAGPVPVRAEDREEEVLPPGYNPAWSTPGPS